MVRNLLLLIVIFYNISFADSFPRIHVFHINGVNTTYQEAIDNMKTLENLANIKYNFRIVSSYGIGHFDLLYNQTHGAFLDVFWDTLGKKFKEGQSISLDDYARSYMEKNPDKAIPESSPAYTQLKLDIESDYKNIYYSQTNFNDVLEQFHDKVPPQFSPLVSYLKSFKESGIVNYNKESMDYIVLIPHSQGNLYANDLIYWLGDNESFSWSNIGAYGIASPASGSVNPYVTADDDGVINALRVFSFISPSKLPLTANAHLESCQDLVCHSLIKAYLHDDKVASVIKSGIQHQIDSDMYQILYKMERQFPYYLIVNTESSPIAPYISNNHLKILDSSNQEIFSINNTNGYFTYCILDFPNYCYYFPKTFNTNEFKIVLNSQESQGSFSGFEVYSNYFITTSYLAKVICENTDKGVECEPFVDTSVGKTNRYISFPYIYGCSIVDTFDCILSYKDQFPDWFLNDNFILQKINISESASI